VPVTYRSDIKPQYNLWVASGFTRYEQHPALKAGLELANFLLSYRASARGFTYELSIEHIMATLRANEITAKDVLIRIAELVAFMEDHPGRIRNQRTEDFMLARGLIHMLRWKQGGARHGAKVLQHLGPLIRDHLYVWALRFVRRLKEDVSRVEELKKQAVDYGDR
jgi:hypothetical protein